MASTFSEGRIFQESDDEVSEPPTARERRKKHKEAVRWEKGWMSHVGVMRIFLFLKVKQ